MTPSRIIAPVGSEVVVLAGICGGDGYYVLNQPLEWMLSNDSVGQFIEIGGMHHPTFNQVVPPSAKKVNGQYAHGRTGLKDRMLTRGTPTPADDIHAFKGQAYTSLSSASPGDLVRYLLGTQSRSLGQTKIIDRYPLGRRNLGDSTADIRGSRNRLPADDRHHKIDRW